MHTLSMRAALFVLGLPPGTPQPVANRFVQKFYGQESVTREGRYRYRKRGLLDTLPHRKLRSGVLIVRQQDVPRIEAFLREWGARFEVREIKPTADDRVSLSHAPR